MSNLENIHIFPNKETYDVNKDKVNDNKDLAFVPLPIATTNSPGIVAPQEPLQVDNNGIVTLDGYNRGWCAKDLGEVGSVIDIGKVDIDELFDNGIYLIKPNSTPVGSNFSFFIDNDIYNIMKVYSATFKDGKENIKIAIQEVSSVSKSSRFIYKFNSCRRRVYSSKYGWRPWEWHSDDMPGTLVWSIQTSIPGHLPCNGAQIRRTSYPRLFSIIGTKYGAGNGTTTFNLPNATNRYLRAAFNGSGSMINAGLPGIHGNVQQFTIHTNMYSDGAFVWGQSESTHGGYTLYTPVARVNFSASRNSGIYGASNSVTPHTYCASLFIKY